MREYNYYDRANLQKKKRSNFVCVQTSLFSHRCFTNCFLKSYLMWNQRSIYFTAGETRVSLYWPHDLSHGGDNGRLCLPPLLLFYLRKDRSALRASGAVRSPVNFWNSCIIWKLATNRIYIYILRSSTGGVAYVTVFNSSASWAATFRLGGYIYNIYDRQTDR